MANMCAAVVNGEASWFWPCPTIENGRNPTSSFELKQRKLLTTILGEVSRHFMKLHDECHSPTRANLRGRGCPESS